MRIVLVSVIASALAGCAFNVEEQSRSFTWERDLAEVSAVAFDDYAFRHSSVEVTGIDTDSLYMSCVVTRLVTEGSQPPDDLDLRMTRADSSDTATLTLAVWGSEWVGATVRDVSMQIGREHDIDLAGVDGDVTVLGMDGAVNVVSFEGSVDVQAGRGGEIEALGSVSVTLTSDTLFGGLTVLAGDTIIVKALRSLSANLELLCRRGTIIVDGREIDERSYEGSLNGGDSERVITCETSGGSIIIEVTDAQ